MDRNRALPYLVGGFLGASLGLGVLLYTSIHSGGAAGVSPDVGGDPTVGVETGPGASYSEAAVDSIAMGQSSAIVRATRRASPAVVSITVIYHEFVRVVSNPLEAFFPQHTVGRAGVRRQPYQILGSGVIIDSKGYIVTNNHVLGEAKESRIFITLGDGRQYEAKLVGRAPHYDLALLQFSETVPEMPVAILGDSDHLEPGEWAIAIGAPYRYLLDDPALTVTVGVISALHRDLEPQKQDVPNYLDMIQTDAAITRGNSGGALVNRKGKVIGINSFIISGPGGGNLGAGFAVPINRVRWVMDEIIRYGGLRPRFSGFDGAILDKRLRYMLNLESSMTGLYVGRVWPHSPAQRAGLKAGDVIRVIEGQSIRRKLDFTRMVFEARVGSQLHLQVQRGDEIFGTVLTLSAGPEDEAAVPEPAVPEAAAPKPAVPEK